MLSNKFIQGNAYEVLKAMVNESVHCCVTSPPYWMLRDYGIEPVPWPAVSFSPMSGLSAMMIPEMICCYGLEDDIWAYVGHTVLIFREVRRILREDGTLWLNIGDSYCGSQKGGNNSEYWGKQKTKKLNGDPGQFGKPTSIPGGLKPKDLAGIPWRVAFALQADGWYLRQDIIWSKPSPMPESVQDRCTKSHEYIMLLSKSKKYYFDSNAISEPYQEKTLSVHDCIYNQDIKNDGTGKAKATNWHNSQRIRKSKEWNKNQGGGGSSFKGHSGYYKADGTLIGNGKANKKSVWTIPSHGFPGAHFATFPEKLIIPCILAGCPPEGIVLDPFSGAGTTALVARKLGRNYVCIEIKREYIEIAKDRLRKEIPLFV